MSGPNLEKPQAPDQTPAPAAAAESAPIAPPALAPPAPSAPSAPPPGVPTGDLRVVGPTPEPGWPDAAASGGVIAIGLGFVVRVVWGFVQALQHNEWFTAVPGVADGWVHKACWWAAAAGMVLTLPRLIVPDKDGRAGPVFTVLLGGLTLAYSVTGVFWTINVIVALIIILIAAYLGLLQFL